MKIILKETIENLGRAGDIVDVKDGFARNYLIPKDFAVKAISGSLKHIETIKKKGLEKEVKDKAHAQSQAEILNNLVLIISKRVGEEGKLFGSVTERNIYEKIENETKISIDRRKIILKENIRYIGEYSVNIRLYPDVNAQVKVRVIDETGREWSELEPWRKEIKKEEVEVEEEIDKGDRIKSEMGVENKKEI